MSRIFATTQARNTARGYSLSQKFLVRFVKIYQVSLVVVGVVRTPGSPRPAVPCSQMPWRYTFTAAVMRLAFKWRHADVEADLSLTSRESSRLQTAVTLTSLTASSSSSRTSRLRLHRSARCVISSSVLDVHLRKNRLLPPPRCLPCSLPSCCHCKEL